LHGELSAVITQPDFKQRMLDLDIDTFWQHARGEPGVFAA
jgi:hypothetical protein